MENGTQIAHVYWSFLGGSTTGIQYHVFIDDDHKEMVEHSEYWTDYNYMCQVELPAVDDADVLKQGAKDFDKKIAVKQLDINRLLEQKSQLLALEAPKASYDVDMPF